MIKRVSRPRYVLSELLKKVSAQNLHEEVATADPVGREVW